MALGGWRSESMYWRYAIASEADLRDGVSRLASFRKTAGASAPMNGLDRGFRCPRRLHTDTKHRFTCLRLPDDLKPVNSKASHKAGAIACCAVLLFFIVILAGCGGGSSSPSPTPTPTPIGNFAPAASLPTMNQGRDSATATLLPNGKVLVAGGFSLGPTGSIVSLANVELYDPATNTFAPPGSTPTMNQARASATAALLPSGKVLIAGGDGLPGDGTVMHLTSVELYDPATNTFAPPGSTPSMNEARANGGNGDLVSVLLANGKVLIAGGVDSFAVDLTRSNYTIRRLTRLPRPPRFP